MNCPSCGTVMREREKEHVVVDVCPNCQGMWLDHGELDKLIELERQRDAQIDDRSRDGGKGKPQEKKKEGWFSTLMESLGGGE